MTLSSSDLKPDGMEKSKLISVLRTFSTSELREFKDFVGSPFYNKNEELVRLYNHLKKLAPRFPFKKIEKEVVYSALFGKKAFDEKHMKYLMSFLLKLAEQFIGLKKYQEDDVVVQAHILEACLDRNLDKSYANIFRKATNELDKVPYKDTNFYYNKYLLADIGNRYFSHQNIRKYNAQLQEASDFFDLYYLGKKLQYSCEMLSSKKFLSTDYHAKMLKEVHQYLDENPHDDIPIVVIYQTILHTLTEESNIAHFHKLKILLRKYFDLFEQAEMKQMYVHAINYCIRKIRQKEEQFVEEALNLYMQGIDTKLLYEGEFLSPWTYINIIKLGLRLGRYDLDGIGLYKPIIPP